MKNILAVMLTVVALSMTSASTIKWGTTGAVFNGATQMTSKNGYTVQGYLMYLGTSDTASWSSVDVEAFSKLADKSTASVAQKTANAAGVVATTSGNFTIAIGNTIPSTTAKLADGDSVFGVLLLSTGTGWGDELTHYVTSSTFTYSESGTGWTTADSSFTINPSIPTGSSWTAIPAVPEPATGALALAGIALLLKRRKAAKA